MEDLPPGGDGPYAERLRQKSRQEMISSSISHCADADYFPLWKSSGICAQRCRASGA
jgi:hypothetical protein